MDDLEVWDGMPDTPPPTYALTVTNGSGSGQYGEGQVVAVQANPPVSGTAFAAWMGDFTCLADRTAATTTVTMPARDVAIVPAYVHVYPLTVNGGSGGGQFPSGAAVDIQADPGASGMVFAGWAGDVSRLADPACASTTVAMPSRAVTVTATYGAIHVPGDLNGDWFVGQADLDIVLSQWGREGEEISDPRADPSGDGFVGQADLDTVLANWGKGILAGPP